MNDERHTPPLRPDAALDWARQAGCVDPVLREIETCVRERNRRRRRAWSVVAAAGAAAAVVALGLFGPKVPLFSERASSQTTVVSAPERQVLPDNSVIELKGGAVVRVAYSEAVRRVELLRGEAHFQVAKNPDRPFVVAAGSLEVKAVGTAFSVQLEPAAVEVIVTEGRVALQAPAEASGDAARAGGAAASVAAPNSVVDVGNRAVVAASPSVRSALPTILPVSPAEMDARLAWRVPRLEFNATPLAEAVDLLNRHSRTRLVLEDASLGSLQVSGTVRADNARALVQLLVMQYGLASDDGRPGEVRLKRPE